MTEKNEVQTTEPKETDAPSKPVYRTPQLRKLGKVNELTDTIPPPGGKHTDGGSFPNSYLS